MNRVIAILSENRLSDVEAVKEFVRSRSARDLLSLSEGLNEALNRTGTEPPHCVPN